MTRSNTDESARRPSGKFATYLSLPTLDVLQRYTIPEASLYLRQSVAKTYQEISAGRLRILKSGARSYVHGNEIARASAESIAA
jgi:hypothetical protein